MPGCPNVDVVLSGGAARHVENCTVCQALVELTGGLDCAQAEPLMAARAAGALSADRWPALLRHLDVCADCRQVMRELESPLVSEVLADGPLQHNTPLGGRSLDRIIARTTTLSERLKLLPNLIEVADAVARAHAERVVHRDLEPERIVVGPFGQTVITGWGQATELTAPSDERVDIRALGAILERVIGGGTLPLPPDTPRELVAIIQRARDADHTPKAAELAASLRGWRDRQSAPRRRHRSAVAILLVILAVLAAVGLWDRCLGA